MRTIFQIQRDKYRDREREWKTEIERVEEQVEDRERVRQKNTQRGSHLSVVKTNNPAANKHSRVAVTGSSSGRQYTIMITAGTL